MKMRKRKHALVQDVWNGPYQDEALGKYVIHRRFGKKRIHLNKPKGW
jgi:hypothetical protein